MHILCTWITSMEHDSPIFRVAVRRMTMQMSYIRIHKLQGAQSEPKKGGEETEHSLSYCELWTRNVNPINKLLTFHHRHLKTTISFSLHITLDNSMSCIYLASIFHPVWPHKDSKFSPLHATPYINCSPAKGSPYLGFAFPDHSLFTRLSPTAISSPQSLQHRWQETTYSSGTLLSTYKIIGCHKPKGHSLNNSLNQNL